MWRTFILGVKIRSEIYGYHTNYVSLSIVFTIVIFPAVRVWRDQIETAHLLLVKVWLIDFRTAFMISGLAISRSEFLPTRLSLGTYCTCTVQLSCVYVTALYNVLSLFWDHNARGKAILRKEVTVLCVNWIPTWYLCSVGTFLKGQHLEHIS